MSTDATSPAVESTYASARADLLDVECRPECGACCIAPSISSPIPGMPDGKPAGVRCIQLTIDNCCLLWGHPDRPAVCNSLRPSQWMCGASAEEAMAILERLERETRP